MKREYDRSKDRSNQGRIQADAWKPGLQCDFFKYGISPGLSEKKL